MASIGNPLLLAVSVSLALPLAVSVSRGGSGNSDDGTRHSPDFAAAEVVGEEHYDDPR